METPASLDVVEDAVRRELDAQERRADAADTRAGLVLGVSGLVASLVPEHLWPPLAVTVQLLAGSASVIALRALGTYVMSELDTLVVRDRYLSEHALRTRLVLLATSSAAAEFGSRRLARKLARLRLASRLVMAALALATAGATVEVVVA